MAKPPRKRARQNVKPGTLILILPVVGAICSLWFVWASVTKNYHLPFYDPAQSSRLQQEDVQANTLRQVFGASWPKNDRKFAYYQLTKLQTVDELSDHYGVSLSTLRALNPGPIIPASTIKIPPVEKPLDEKTSTGLGFVTITEDKENIVRLQGREDRPLTVTTIPALANLLKNLNVFTEVSPRVWQLNRPLFLDTNIRLNITNQTIDKLQLASLPNQITCLCLEDAEALIKGVSITSVDPKTGLPDTNTDDERSYIRARSNSRMDIINADISYLGNGILTNPAQTAKLLQQGGATYGVSWRIPDGQLGKRLVTGWVENSSFHNNYFGAYTFGASGMVWRGNHFYQNDKYGLDPHDDSNNALIENNLFENNGTHGFIVSKRCDNNVIRNNLSRNNGLAGFMLHQDSDNNVIAGNEAYGNVDNVVVYASNNNMIRDNNLRQPKKSNIRINHDSGMNYIVNNNLEDGTGIDLYDNVATVYIVQNRISAVQYVLTSKAQVDAVVLIDNLFNKNAVKVHETSRFVNVANTIIPVGHK